MKPELIILMVVTILTFAFLRRKREVDKLGNPTIRLWAPGLFCFFVSLFWLKNLVLASNDSVGHVHTDDSTVLMFFFIFSLIGAGIFFYAKITLTENALEARYLPFFTKTYPLGSIQSIQKNGQTILINAANGAKIPIFYFSSGTSHFLEVLKKLIDGSKFKF